MVLKSNVINLVIGIIACISNKNEDCPISPVLLEWRMINYVITTLRVVKYSGSNFHFPLLFHLTRARLLSVVSVSFSELFFLFPLLSE